MFERAITLPALILYHATVEKKSADLPLGKLSF